MIPKELQERINNDALIKANDPYERAAIIRDMELGALLALEYVGERWASVEERPKESGVYQIVHLHTNEGRTKAFIEQAMYSKDKDVFMHTFYIDTLSNPIIIEFNNVTHWKPLPPLPQPPKTDNDEK